MTDSIKEIMEWKEKAIKYDRLAPRYVEIADKLKKVETDIAAIRQDIDPYKSMAGRSRNSEIKTITKELYEKIQAGVQVNRHLIEKAYPDLNTGQIGNVMTQLQLMKGIDKRKEGKGIFLFARHN